MPIDASNMEITLSLIRSIKVKNAVRNMRESALGGGIMDKDIAKEIDAAREGR